MTQGQHKSTLQHFYEECIATTKQYLENKYSLQPCNKDDVDYPSGISNAFWHVWKIKVENNLHPLTFILAIPKTYPDKFPKIYLSKKDYQKITPIPHVDKNRFVCTRDPQVEIINDERPGEGLDTLISIASTEIIGKGIKEENTDDFIEEFLAYWNDDAEYEVLSLFSPSDDIESLKLVRFSTKFLGSLYLIAKSTDEAQKWLEPFQIGIDEQHIYDVLYLSFPGPFPLPRGNRDYYEIIKQAGEKHLSATDAYFKRRDSKLFIVFSFPLKGERILAAWKETNPSEINGFRKGKIPLKQKIIHAKIKKLRVERIDKERLFSRGGSGVKASIKDRSIAIIGCGSLGSHLAVSLSKTGISKFLLVDNEYLEPENIARHVCGFHEAGFRMHKSEAVMTRLIQHLPHIDCTAYCDDILDLLQKEESLLNNHDLVIVAIGNRAVERRLNYLLRKGMVTSPLLFTWTEPFGVAGQFLYIHPDSGGCYQCCFDNNGWFLYSVAESDVEYHKRETGCQSTFVQYSNLDIEYFVNIAARKIMSFFEDKPNCSLLCTCIGDVSFFKSLDYKIRDEWLADSSYTTHTKLIPRNRDCKTCQQF